MRWREALVGGAAVLVGLWWTVGPSGLLAIPGAALLVAGGALIWIGVQRGRFRGDGGGTGAVQVDEGQVTYFGPLNGGAVALRELDRLTLDRTVYPPHWRLDQPGQPPLLIPVNAEGTDALFDAFATLPGFRTERMLGELQARRGVSVVIWEREPLRPAHLPLH
ncbi:hypothetical protein [Sulfitobacter sabulilitoris]|uniref:Uncharacterized protein n=1 Tax=Sulfitobacter sabulilitoris TaxID=2562655 RepID=A0A5S3PN08_9RHOB|nr:hypothetical protein [Sulfitobacter sabulilitoris]TMM55666.1 hypothetical protein FDT80_08255 [Sulfitobacter sabulilitoris]